MANKWTFKNTNVNLSKDKNLCRLIQFYLIESPVPGASVKGKTFKEYGWESGSFLTLQAEMKKCALNFNQARWVSPLIKDVPKKLEELGRLKTYDCSFEFAVHCVKSDLNKTSALFYLIRNGFAHGGFRKSEYKGVKYYVFENKQDKKLKGRAVFGEQTLLAWTELVKRGPKVTKR